MLGKSVAPADVPIHAFGHPYVLRMRFFWREVLNEAYINTYGETSLFFSKYTTLAHFNTYVTARLRACHRTRRMDMRTNKKGADN